MCVYVRAKFEVSSKLLTSFRLGVILPPPPQPQNEPLKSPPRLLLTYIINCVYSKLRVRYLTRF